MLKRVLVYLAVAAALVFVSAEVGIFDAPWHRSVEPMPSDAAPRPVVRPTMFHFHSGGRVVLRGDEQLHAYFVAAQSGANALDRPASRLWLVAGDTTTFVTDKHCVTGQLRVDGVRVDGPVLVLDREFGGFRAGTMELEPEDVFGVVSPLESVPGE